MRISKDFWLISKPVAHRGLWNGKITENSLSAYKNAIDNGYPIEIDLYSSLDNEIYSFHDKTLTRMTGCSGFIYEKTSNEIDGLFLNNTKERIPKFTEVLKLVNGKVPLLIEIKDQPNPQIEKIVDLLKSYNGEFALQSFNPLYILKVKKLAPKFIRGILSTNDYFDLKTQNILTRFIIKNMALNFLIKPDFISYNYKGYPLKKSKTKNKILLAWTVTDENIYDNIKPYCHNIIFENFIPNKKPFNPI